MATVYAEKNEEKIKKLILLAPALNADEFNSYSHIKIHLPAIMYHGSKDDVVPPAVVRDIAREVFTNLHYHLVDDDHYGLEYSVRNTKLTAMHMKAMLKVIS